MRLKTPVAVTLLLVALVAGAGVTAAMSMDGQHPQQSGPADGPLGETIQVSDTGTAESEPDQAVINVAVTATGPDASTVRTRLADNASQLRGALTEAGITGDRIRTVRYDIGPERVRPPSNDDEPRTRYEGQHRFAIELSDLDRTGEIIDIAVSNGANTVENVQFTLSADRRQELRREALRDAVANARDQATTLAAAGDLEVTGVYRIQSGDGGFVPRYETVAAGGGDGGGTVIDQGPVTVRVRIDVTFTAAQA